VQSKALLRAQREQVIDDADNAVLGMLESAFQRPAEL
jgi:hypothetical protein